MVHFNASLMPALIRRVNRPISFLTLISLVLSQTPLVIAPPALNTSFSPTCLSVRHLQSEVAILFLLHSNTC